ncbi:MAG: hypothetical protein ACD_17C00296G0002 [uncultured bacterium]|nr:MAG: hypothetical protein ACD_17C00296G0002 [uncultured bacterium]OGN68687.1 MAG: hypothetical protein A3I67_02975 [Chlamydiae bacterium RIFCSPLOWO2_02_FULL_45_22]
MLWAVLLFAAYIWVMTSDRDQWVIQQGKYLYKTLVAWFDDAEVDFQLKYSQPAKNKKKSRRWD